jgi:hypothetical protein
VRRELAAFGGIVEYFKRVVMVGSLDLEPLRGAPGTHLRVLVPKPVMPDHWHSAQDSAREIAP